MARDKNPRRYTLTVVAVDPVPVAGLQHPQVVLEFSGALSARAKREMTEAVERGDVLLAQKNLA